MKRIILSIVFFVMAGSFAFGQNTASTTAPVNISLVRGLTIATSGSNSLDFGEVIVNTSTQTVSINNEDGQKFLVTGHPDRSTTVTYDATVTLDNDAWVTTNGGTNSTLTFTANTADQTGKISTYTDPVALASGGSVNLVNDDGTGKLYIWVGGSIAVPSSQPQGDYVGTFNISVSY